MINRQIVIEHYEINFKTLLFPRIRKKGIRLLQYPISTSASTGTICSDYFVQQPVKYHPHIMLLSALLQHLSANRLNTIYIKDAHQNAIVWNSGHNLI